MNGPLVFVVKPMPLQLKTGVPPIYRTKFAYNPETMSREQMEKEHKRICSYYEKAWADKPEGMYFVEHSGRIHVLRHCCGAVESSIFHPGLHIGYLFKDSAGNWATDWKNNVALEQALSWSYKGHSPMNVV